MDDRMYRAKFNTIVDQDGDQIAVVLPVNCSMKVAREIAAYAAQQMNVRARNKNLISAAMDKRGDR